MNKLIKQGLICRTNNADEHGLFGACCEAAMERVKVFEYNHKHEFSCVYRSHSWFVVSGSIEVLAYKTSEATLSEIAFCADLNPPDWAVDVRKRDDTYWWTDGKYSATCIGGESDRLVSILDKWPVIVTREPVEVAELWRPVVGDMVAVYDAWEKVK